MKIPYVIFDGRVCLDVLGLEAVLRDLVAALERDYPAEAEGIRRVVRILEAVIRREESIEA